MYDPQTNNFHERLAALEAAVRDIQRTLELHASDPIEHMLTEDTHGSRLSDRADEAEVWPANAAQLVVRSPLESTNIERSSFAVEGLQSGHEGVDRPHEG